MTIKTTAQPPEPIHAERTTLAMFDACSVCLRLQVLERLRLVGFLQPLNIRRVL